MRTLFSLALTLLAAATGWADTFVYVSVARDKKIAAYRMDPKDGRLTHTGDTATDGEPAALTTDPDRKFLFASLRAEGKLSAFRIDPLNGKLKHLNTVDTSADPAHISTDSDGHFLLCAYYVAGKVTVHAIGTDGSLSAKPVHSIDTAEKAHAVQLDPANRFAFVPHTGPNAIYQFTFDAKTGTLKPGATPKLTTPDKTGPRHIVFHPDGVTAYVDNEQGGSVAVYRLSQTTGALKAEQTLTTLPADFKGANACAEIRLHPTGRFLYVANRGHDSIAGFRVGDDARLTAIGQTATEKTPRSFDIDPSGRFLYAAGESSGKLAAYRLDEKSGELTRFDTYDTGRTPWWVLAVPMPALADTAAELRDKAKRSLAKLDGEATLPGLKEPVEVLRDRWGIPHIYAKNAGDLFFAQGFVAAQDRLFQIDLWRRQGVGEMAEVFGPEFVAADRFARLMKFRGDMDAEWTSYSPDTKEIVTRFTEGINACIDQMGDKLPIEFQILGIKPKKWKPEDVLTRMSGIYMSQNFRNEIQRGQLIAAVGVEKARWLAPVDPPRDYAAALGDEDLKAIGKHILADYEAATKALSFTPAKTESNNWVVAGARSASGKPLLASDPHRAIALPSLRYLVHLNAPGWNVIGSGEPALPGVALGHNEHIAWGFTIIGVDQADIYVEETHPLIPGEYRVNGKWTVMTGARETIAVKGEKERTVDLLFTRHGPVLYRDAKRHRVYALEWAGSDPGGAAYLGSLAVGRAKNQKEILEALKSWKVPGLNFVYADVEGNIGWIAAAQTPRRPKHDGLLPVPGDGGFEWDGYLKVADLPQSFNPKSGWLATANHNIIPEGYKRQIGYEFAPPYRFERIKQELTTKEKWNLADFRALQHDQKSLPGLALARLLKGVKIGDAKLVLFQNQLAEWDGRLAADSSVGSLFAHWLREIQEALVGRHLTKEQRKDFGALATLPTLVKALETADQRWFGLNPAAARDELLRATFATAVKKLHDLPTPHQERWGALHTATFRHPLATFDPAIARAFDVGPFERGGDANTPNNTRYDDKYRQIHGASYRHLIDLADWDRALATSAPGQSGQPGSPHYADLAPLWAKAEYFPLAYSRKKVDEVTTHRLQLRPAAPR